jgi:hypothetical protein
VQPSGHKVFENEVDLAEFDTRGVHVGPFRASPSQVRTIAEAGGVASAPGGGAA